ncbi:alpha-galactosidase [Clostridium oryzae]|uniref:Alpha-galactosidase n=1 Tax=Clostridium oryzae TaxID=1450648 RepID=A0A1V4IU35_9CLOT|nr:alpha-galactosidase [Clostridium oryzae]OPJ63532.1 alpha-galactosidase [Clostridium oryzae]
MPILYDKEHKLFHLQAADTSYIIQIFETGHLAHLYWGKRINKLSFNNFPITAVTNFKSTDPILPIDVVPQEFPSFGAGDFRTPAYQVQLENGSTVTDLLYVSHKIYKGKPSLDNLPSTYVENDDEADTLEITLEDKLTGLNVILLYTAYRELNVITRAAKLINLGKEKLKLLSALSMSVDFNDYNYDLLQLSGCWCRERHIFKRALVPGVQSIESKRGMSSHTQNPFIALLDKDVTETHGTVYGFNLIYSGNFLAQVEVDPNYLTRILMGINPFDFSWLLDVNESFQTPEVVMVYSDCGLGNMSRTYHNLYRKRLCRGNYRDKLRPILVNNWEATYFNFNADKIKSIANTAKELGIELFVLDDGWFGKRNSDNCSLGDWIVDKNKLPDGLESLVKSINDNGTKFGLWFEPEMVSPDSDLYRAHPDWCIHVPNRKPAQGKFQRNQLVLDLTREEVCNYIIDAVSNILKSAPISYVKWDMNRAISDVGSESLPAERQRETSHRYVLGLYKVMDKITSAFPNVLFESCASGGGRFDGGILYYMPQTWTSDDTDAVERLKIQYGTSIVYPAITMGAHVSASPNHQLGRETKLSTRADAAMAGNFGYELDLTKFTDEEKSIVKQQVEKYKEIRHITQFGDFYRLRNPFESNEAAWIFVSKDKKEAFASYFKVLAKPFTLPSRLVLEGLNPDYTYEVIGSDMTFGGDELMYIGLDTTELKGDFTSITWRLKAI